MSEGWRRGSNHVVRGQCTARKISSSFRGRFNHIFGSVAQKLGVLFCSFTNDTIFLTDLVPESEGVQRVVVSRSPEQKRKVDFCC